MHKIIYDIYSGYMINDTPKKLITFNPRNIEMMKAIESEIGLTTAGEICRRAIEELYGKYFKAYATTSRGNPTNNEESAMLAAKIRAKTKVVEKQTEEELRNQKKVTMCERMLGGYVHENANGSKSCKFTQYTLQGDSELTVPLNQVDPIIAETSLFMPSRVSVFKNRPEVENIFKKLKPIEE